MCATFRHYRIQSFYLIQNVIRVSKSIPEAEPDTIRHELHLLLDHIPDNDVPAARKFLRSLVDPVEFSLLTAVLDDEPETVEDRAAVETARGEPGPGTPHEEVLREFGARTDLSGLIALRPVCVRSTASRHSRSFTP